MLAGCLALQGTVTVILHLEWMRYVPLDRGTVDGDSQVHRCLQTIWLFPIVCNLQLPESVSDTGAVSRVAVSCCDSYFGDSVFVLGERGLEDCRVHATACL